MVGVEICIDSPPGYGCATTDETGRFNLRGPPNAEWTMLASSPGYRPALFQWISDDQDVYLEGVGQGLATELLVSVMVASTGETLDDSKGQVTVWVSGSEEDSLNDVYVPGVRLELEAGTYENAAYLSFDGTFDASLTETEYGGRAFVNVEPGTWLVTAEHPTLTCRAWVAFAGPEPDTAYIVSKVGYDTHAFLICE